MSWWAVNVVSNLGTRLTEAKVTSIFATILFVPSIPQLLTVHYPTYLTEDPRAVRTKIRTNLLKKFLSIQLLNSNNMPSHEMESRQQPSMMVIRTSTCYTYRLQVHLRRYNNIYWWTQMYISTDKEQEGNNLRRNQFVTRKKINLDSSGRFIASQTCT